GGEESGLSAVILAHDRLRLGATRAALAAGVEEYADLVHASLLSEGRAARDAAGGLSPMPGPIAEGAAVQVLEEAAAARARGARLLATVRWAGRARPLARDGDVAAARAVVRAARAACAAAAIAPDEVDLVVAGGAGGRRSRVELAALAALFAEAPPRERWLCAPQAQWGEGFAVAPGALPGVAARAL